MSSCKNPSTSLAFLVLLTTFGYDVKADEYNTPNFSNQISANLQLFLGQTLEGCTLRTVLDGRRPYSEDHLVMLSSRQSSFKTFIVDRFNVPNGQILYRTELGLSVKFRLYRAPEWLSKKYTTCATHLYLTENSNDLEIAIGYHFIDFDLRKQNPDYVIIWDLSQSQIRYEEIFSNQEFYRSFMDYRLLIRRDYLSNQFDVSLVCMWCPWRFPQGVISTSIAPATKSNIHEFWKYIHRNHLGIELPCRQCLMQTAYHQLKYRIDSFPWLVSKLTNVTLTLVTNDIWYSIGFISQDNYLTRESAATMSTENVYPRMIISPSFLTTFEYKMFTVVRKNLLVNPGLGVFLIPFKTFAWFSILFSVPCIFILTSRVTIHLPYSVLLLSIFGPLTDQWTLSFRPSLNRIFLLWGILCYSLTVLYGGELASSLAVLSPPAYPTSIEKLLDISTAIISLQVTGAGTSHGSALVAIFESQRCIWKNTRPIENQHNMPSRLARVIELANLGYCWWEMRIWNRSNEETPFLCKNKPNITTSDKPITFVDYGFYHLLQRYVFQDSSLYWVSSTSQEPELQDKLPLTMSRNYFAKLVLPFASFWAASGLENVWEEVQQIIRAGNVYSQKQTTFPADMKAESTRVIDFAPLSLHSHLAVITLWAICFGVALAAFLMEGLSGTCVAPSFWFHKLMRLCENRKTIVQNIRRSSPRRIFKGRRCSQAETLNVGPVIMVKHTNEGTDGFL